MENKIRDIQDELLISILIPTYNRPEKTLRAVYSALQQNYSHIEVIVTDNSDNDQTKNLLESIISDKRLRYYKNEANIGLLNNWKKALGLAKGAYIKILFSDDWMDSSFCKDAFFQFQINPSVTAVFSNVLLRTYEKDIILYSFNKTQTFALEDYLENLIFKSNLSLSPGNFIFRSEAIQFKEFYYNDDLNMQVNNTGAGADILLVLSSLIQKNTIAIGLPFFYSFFESKDDSVTLNKWPLVSAVYNKCLYEFVQESDISNKIALSKTLSERVNGKQYRKNSARKFLKELNTRFNPFFK